jgi:hypothetical protein
MSALSDLTQTSGTSTTTLPSWYDTAQQNLISSAVQNAASAPQLNQTVAQGAINTLQGQNNPFTQAGSTLNTIATGAANPWITDPTTGAVTPNTNTAMGGLFQAQRDQLNQTLPTLTSGTEAGAIGSGNFGSLRGQTAVDTAKANALSQLQSLQMQAALQNQQTGVSAAANQGNVGQQGITNAMSVGQEQMTAPFTSTANLGNILASLNVPQTVSTTQTPSVLGQIGGALTGLSGVGTGTNNLLTSLGVSGGLSGLSSGIGNWINSITAPVGTTDGSGAPLIDTTTPAGVAAATTSEFGGSTGGAGLDTTATATPSPTA